MSYSRIILQGLHRDHDNPEKYDRIVQELCDKVSHDEEITLVEEYFVGGIIEQLRNEKGERALKIEDYGQCRNYYFRSRYLRYVNDLNGHKVVMDYNGPIPPVQKRKDVAYLEKEYLA